MGSQNILVDFYINENETIEEVKEFLKSAGIDPAQSITHFKKLIQKKEAKLKIQEGKAVQEKFNAFIRGKSIKKLRETIGEITREQPQLAIAFNKLEALDESNIDIILGDEIKLEIIKRLREEENGK